jgi:hypothetical protein
MLTRPCLTLIAALIGVSAPAFGAPPEATGARDTGVRTEELPDKQTRERWLLALEGALNAPVDLGLRATLDTPARVRVLGGYGWIPSAYFSSIASGLTSDPRAESILDDLDFTGNVWRVGAGVRPLPKLGLYLDGGYARASLDASLTLASSELPELRAVGGDASMSSRLNLWFFELGYQAQVLERIVLAGGLGATGTLDSHTTVDGSSVIATSAISDLAQDVDDAFESYGFVPTLSLRLGVDLI